MTTFAPSRQMSETTLNFWRPIAFSALQHLDLFELRRMQNVAAGWRMLVNQYIEQYIDTKLTSFLSNPTRLRAMLSRYHSAIAGDVALTISRMGTDVIGEVFTALSLLEIYCPVGGYPADIFVRHLEQQESYRVDEITNTDPGLPHPEDKGHVLVVRLVRPDGMRIDVVVASQATATLPLPFTSGTHSMNLLTGNSFIIAYPLLTLNGHTCINPMQPITEQVIADCETLQLQAHTFAENHPAVTGGLQATFYCPHQARMIGDKGCLVVVFSNPDIVFTRKVLHTTRWMLGGDKCSCCSRSSETTIVNTRMRDDIPLHTATAYL
ncbi:uncharacterized protein STEHIDRAFT_129352 [Stereum hirsutum FP-91666 SS1]|uniref:uncharacterized protein n=1 Tax=Stereum hirsutum (strain FP-91666) TaxID=721885 RepID=UPI000440C284|nr:uncharacterized protein STEHIDRAFT_129352 [Stereum hirsutum FP-91666 SS1]EIM88687.1 hypothetical protein STEHIDRAFT_129352 [Stereum hirsutum FP-91666 SS1]